MYDANKIITGLLIFLGLITFPIWYALASAKAAQVPQPAIATSEKQCIESTEYMRENHMKLLERWRESVVRDGVRVYTASDGKEYEMSLTSTCLRCHSNKAEFCDQCHNYVGVTPNCWECHNVPEGD